jgi:hypothetical protein
MTTTISPHDTGDVGARTQNIAPFIEGLPPALRRPDATGEHPILAPVGVDELNRLSAGETLVLDAGVTPAEQPVPSVPREPVPTVYERRLLKAAPPKHQARARWHVVRQLHTGGDIVEVTVSTHRFEWLAERSATRLERSHRDEFGVHYTARKAGS